MKIPSELNFVLTLVVAKGMRQKRPVTTPAINQTSSVGVQALWIHLKEAKVNEVNKKTRHSNRPLPLPFRAREDLLAPRKNAIEGNQTRWIINENVDANLYREGVLIFYDKGKRAFPCLAISVYWLHKFGVVVIFSL